MPNRVDRHRLQVAEELATFIETQALPGTGIDAAHFWENFSKLAHDRAPENRELLATRDRMQGQIDQWHRDRHNQPHGAVAHPPGRFHRGIFDY